MPPDNEKQDFCSRVIESFFYCPDYGWGHGERSRVMWSLFWSPPSGNTATQEKAALRPLCSRTGLLNEPRRLLFGDLLSYHVLNEWVSHAFPTVCEFCFLLSCAVNFCLFVSAEILFRRLFEACYNMFGVEIYGSGQEEGTAKAILHHVVDIGTVRRQLLILYPDQVYSASPWMGDKTEKESPYSLSRFVRDLISSPFRWVHRAWL